MKLFSLLFPTWIISMLLAVFVPEVIASQIPKESDKTIKIGLLIQDGKYTQARDGAQMAIGQANMNGGINGRQIQLVTRSMEGPWGTGSKEAVNLIFDQGVWAILGSHDGRNAHLVEQVIAKMHTIFLSAWASDPTLSEAFVPWYFSCAPNDLQQADALFKEIYFKRNISKIATVTSDDYDSKSALNSFLKRTKKAGKEDPLQLFYDNSTTDFGILLDQINNAGVGGIILFAGPSAAAKFIQQKGQKKMNQPLFGTLSLLNENHFSYSDLKNYETTVLVFPGNWSGPESLSFQSAFQRKFGRTPGLVAALAFDGMNLLIEAIKKCGSDREKIQRILSETDYEGVTGKIHFDAKGNRLGTPELKEIKNGVPISVEK